MITFQKISESNYIVRNNISIFGKIIKDKDDSYFYFWPENKNSQCWDGRTMQLVSQKLNNLNKQWDEEVNSYFNSQLKNKRNYALSI